jgi:fido (protein-threonine AMPylation protein)
VPEANEKLAEALAELRQLQADGTRVFASDQLSRTARERLIKHGFLQEAMRGWLISSSPTAQPGDTTPWFASFWEFCRRYCEAQFGDAWHLSAEQSLLIHAESTVVPRQVILYSPAASNNRIELPFQTSFFALKQREMPPASELEVVRGLRVFRAEVALTRVTADFFVQYPVEAQVALGSIREPSGLLSQLLDGGHSVVAGRLAGAFRRQGQPALADEIVSAMTAADHDVRESDPFDLAQPPVPPARATPPLVARLQLLWATAREPVLAEVSGLRRAPTNLELALRRIDGLYQLDAYHSLSIEGYQVTPELIARVASGEWDPDRLGADRDQSNALAARGYWLAFRRVRATIGRLFASGDLGILRTAHREWYREMFSPHVAAGVLAPALLAGYRNHPVYLRGSRHVPPRSELLRDAMPALLELIEHEPHPVVRAVLGHWMFGYVHPFPDGNGRVARLLMNSLLVASGHPWTVILVEDRAQYLEALEAASVAGDARPFARFVAGQMARSREMARVRARGQLSQARRRGR